MSTIVTSVTSHFPSAQNGFTTTLASTISSGAGTVPLNSVAGYTNGQTAVFVVDPTDVSKKQTFTGVIDTSGIQVTGVVWTAGTNQAHTGGATIVDYATATHISMITKGILKFANQDGTLLTSAVRAALNLDSGTSTGWTVLGYALNTVTANGNHSYTCVFNSNDLTTTISAGMRLRFTRTVLAPTQCTSLNGTTQYYSKTSPSGMTFTDDFTVSAWVKLTSYPASGATIASRYNGTSGWDLRINPTGQLILEGYNSGAANNSEVTSYQSVPLNKWVHIAAQLDMSAFTATTTTSYTMMDGVDVPASVTRGGTNPTTLIQPVADLQIGAGNSTLFFPGKIAQVAIYSAKVTQATILASMNQTLSGSETSLISAYSFNGIKTDLNTSNANNLTANGSAVETNADSPYGAQAGGTVSSTLDYGIVQSVAFSTNTTVIVQVPEGCTIPTTGGVSAVSYSVNKVPYGMPLEREKWRTKLIIRTTVGVGAVSQNTWYNPSGHQMVMPGGPMDVSVQVTPYHYKNTSTTSSWTGSLSTSNSTATDTDFHMYNVIEGASSTIEVRATQYRSKGVNNAIATIYYLIALTDTGGGTNDLGFQGASSATIIQAEPSYL